MALGYVPTGWPDGVHPPGSPGFEQTAVNWLLDVVPPDYRLHGVLVRHPIALATLARHHLAACVEGAREGYRRARTELGKDLPPGGLAAVLEAYRSEGRRLVAASRAVDLVTRALRGDTFVPQQGGSRPVSPASTAVDHSVCPFEGDPQTEKADATEQEKDGEKQVWLRRVTQKRS